MARRGRDSSEVWVQAHTLLYIKQITNKDTQYFVITDMGKNLAKNEYRSLHNGIALLYTWN